MNLCMILISFSSGFIETDFFKGLSSNKRYLTSNASYFTNEINKINHINVRHQIDMFRKVVDLIATHILY